MIDKQGDFLFGSVMVDIFLLGNGFSSETPSSFPRDNSLDRDDEKQDDTV